jgi:V/A-type H+/Na+-transporting ATPase subunit E
LPGQERGNAVNGLDAILDRIMSDADETVRDIEEQSGANCDRLLTAAGRESAEFIAAEKKKAEEQAAALIIRTESLAALETRKTILSARQALIDTVITKAAEHLASLVDEEKSALYKRLLSENATGTESVVFSARDRAIAGRILPEVNLEKGWNLTLDPETGEFAAGLVLCHGPVRTNLSVDLLIRNLRQELVSLAAQTLFGG